MAEIGVIGGSGLYALLSDPVEHAVDTPYGRPSDVVVTGTYAGREVAFLPRHGRGHRIPPHAINYRANLWALRELGVTRVIAPCSVGSLQPDIPPGTFVLVDQVVDRTRGRGDTYFDGPEVVHASLADPYCPQLRAVVGTAVADRGLPWRDSGTLVVIEGPRFSTRAESRWFTAMGWHVVGMTSYPEVALARELELCCVGIALVTDHDVGLADLPDIEPVSAQRVMDQFASNVDNLRDLLTDVVRAIPAERTCPCGSALDGARLS